MDPARVIDVCTHDVPLEQKLPGLPPACGEGGAPPAAGSGGPKAESLASLIEAMDGAGVTTSLVVLQEEVGEFLRLACQHPGRLFGLARYDPARPRDLERVQGLSQTHPDSVVGVHAAVPEGGPDPRDRAWAPLYAYCLRQALPIQFRFAGERRAGLMALAVLAASHPQLKIVSLGGGGRAGPEEARALRSLPNLFAASGAPPGPGGVPATRPHPPPMGSRRWLFGSGWPVGRAVYPDQVAGLRQLPWWLRQHVAWRSALRVYGPRILAGRPAPAATHSGAR